MNILELLNEQLQLPSQGLSFNDLNSLHIAVLKKIANGDLSQETARPREIEVMDELSNFGLLDDTGQLTNQGQRMAKRSSMGNSAELRQVAQRDGKLGREPFGQRQRWVNDPGSDMDDSEIDDVTNVGTGLNDFGKTRQRDDV